MNMSTYFRTFEKKISREFEIIQNDRGFKEHWTINRKKMEDYLRKNNFISCIYKDCEYWSTPQKILNRITKGGV